MFIKICGITSVADAVMAAREGASAIGLNFYEASPRAVTLATAAEIIGHLQPFVDPVGLFVNATSQEVRRIAQPLGLRTIQLHGDTHPELIAELGEFSVLLAFPLADDAGMETILTFLQESDKQGRLPAAVLVDAHKKGLYGGTGKTAPWDVAGQLIQRSTTPVALAGGLTPKNVAQAIRTVRPWGVDVASGVEVAPGRKEAYKVKAFIRAVQEAERNTK